jgi:hypothetical protein
MEIDFNPRQKVSQFLAFSFIILISLSLGWYSIKASEEILAKMPDSEIINVNRRVNLDNLDEDGVRNVPREKAIKVMNEEKDSQE